MFLNNLFLYLNLITTVIQNGLSLYFPQEEVRVLKEPLEKTSPLFHIYAILDPDEIGSIVYSLTKWIETRCPTLDMDEKRGIVYTRTGENETLSPEGLSRWTCNYTVTARLVGELGTRGKGEANLTLTLIGGSHWRQNNRNHCSILSKEDLCFSGTQEFQLQIMENNDEVLGAHLGYETMQCGSMVKVSYKISTPADVIFIGKGDIYGFSPYGLVVKKDLDRESQDIYTFDIICYLTTDGITTPSTSTIPLTLRVIDQDDNPPTTQEGLQHDNVAISFKNLHNKYEPHRRLIQEHPKTWLFRDLDTIDVNKFNVTIRGDKKGLFNITHSTVAVASKNMSAYTVVMPNLQLSSKIEKIHPWMGLYCVEALFNDTTLWSKSHDNSSMEYKICIHWMNENYTVDLDAQSFQVDDEVLNGNETRGELNKILPFPAVGRNDGDYGGCDDVCIMLLGTCVTVIFILVIGILYAFKSRVSGKKKSGRIRNLLSVEGHSVDHSGNNIIISELEYIGSGNRNPLHVFPTNALTQDTDMAIDSKWEIPRGALILEEVLGVGEFGRVFKGQTNVIPGYEGTYLHVAVKMLKDNQEETGKSCRQEFLAEFSLLKQVDHPNVIKLLGACTTAGGPLYLVMEYAEFGSLRSFLRKCRRVESLHNGNPEADFSGNTVPSTPNDMEEKDYFVSPQEIFQFSWQIAKGMTYLSDMKMVHRDLAARNILLTGTKVCKISDFGLTRDIYIDEAYQKKSRDRVPVKWLAPESLADEVYTTKSDVWSFGVLLWELATLGSSPYPGIASEQLYTLLKSGYRMDHPPNCSVELYGLMRQCWGIDPRNRPHFRDLGISLSKLLEDGIEYLKLDIPLVSNPGYEYFSPSEELFPLNYESQI